MGEYIVNDKVLCRGVSNVPVCYFWNLCYSTTVQNMKTMWDIVTTSVLEAIKHRIENLIILLTRSGLINVQL